MSYNLSNPSPGAPGNVATPAGWKAEWSAQYTTYFYINLSTNESTWVLPTPPIPQMPQRKPVAAAFSQPQTQMSAAIAQRTCVESYPTPPPQVSTGYFPSTGSPQTQQQHQPQPARFVSPVQQQNDQAAFHPRSQYAELPTPVQQQLPVQYQQQQQMQPQFAQYQQQAPQLTNTHVPNAGVQQNNSPVAGAPRYPQQQQVMSPPQTPVYFNPQQQSPIYAPSPQLQQGNYGTPGTIANTRAVVQTPQPNGSYNYSQSNQYSQPTQQVAQVPNSYPNQAQAQSQYLPQQPQPQYQAHAPATMQPQNRTSSFMGGGNGMMGKMSSKFTQFQKGGAPSAAHPNGKAPADWKKWAKRGAIGVAGIGALALGVDAAGDMISGAEGLDFGGGEDFSGGGEEFSGGGYEGGDAAAAMDAQTAVDANAAQLNLEMAGQEQAVMLTDPPGTEYVMTNAQDTQNAMGLI